MNPEDQLGPGFSPREMELMYISTFTLKGVMKDTLANNEVPPLPGMDSISHEEGIRLTQDLVLELSSLLEKFELTMDAMESVINNQEDDAERARTYLGTLMQRERH